MFRPRNPYYLRISEKIVLPIYLYLDDRHLEWMSDRILQHVLEDLRPNILAKLQEEKNSKKKTVDTHRGESYQFCYFIRNSQPHSLVFKTRSFTAEARQNPPRPVPIARAKSASKRKPSTTVQRSRKKQKTKGKSKAVPQDNDSDEFDPFEDDEEDEESASDPEDFMDADDEGLSVNDEGRIVKTVEFSLNDDDEEEKPKPILHLKYRGFEILGQCLCIVVEPWPAIRAPSRAPSVFRAPSRAPTIAPPNFVTAAEARARTPLFLPDIDERESSEAPFSFQDRASTLPPVPRFNDTEPDNDDYGGMMEFSQVLHAAGDERARAVDDDEDMEGGILFADADEFREL
ncbi:hypothetical protein D9758_008857 [Tetrapyrgos nigripes]|uniref:Uncharacterized protein n=1 Tax=Tetrapyrgos nigripes TaxID=182062 RepID=A0A8H5FP86_9AGAR|nr:hypothetical protein D9758_008857 [Tetrapyrgos nigripes]